MEFKLGRPLAGFRCFDLLLELKESIKPFGDNIASVNYSRCAIVLWFRGAIQVVSVDICLLIFAGAPGAIFSRHPADSFVVVSAALFPAYIG